jgi:hypothetical protein
MDDPETNPFEKFAKRIETKYIGFEPMLLIAVIALLIIYYYVFSSLGNNEDGKASSIKVFFETSLWLLFIILLLLNGISYIFGIDIIKSLKTIFGYEDHINAIIEPEERKEIKMVLKDQVFHLPQQKYTFDDAAAVCNAYGARLASYDEMETAYSGGADWCTLGWSKNHSVLFPTQKEKWKKLQKMPGHEKECGHPGVNGGYVQNAGAKAGVNCFGNKPSITRDDSDRMRRKPLIKKNAKEQIFDKRVDFWRSKLSAIEIAPFNHNNWSML